LKDQKYTVWNPSKWSGTKQTN